jgi:hypothetical protein
MHQRQASAARQQANRNTLRRHFLADGKARLKIRVAIAIFAVIIETQRLAANVTANGLAESRKSRAASRRRSTMPGQPIRPSPKARRSFRAKGRGDRPRSTNRSP